MKFIVSAATVAALFSVLAQANYTQNPIHAPMGGDVVPACQQYIIKWSPTTPGRVDILLKKGPSDNLGDVGPITIAVPNSGVFYWQVPCDIATGNDYAIEIKAPNDEINFTGIFTIQNSGKSKPETTTTASSSAASASASTTGTEKTTPTHSGTGAASTGHATSVSHSGSTTATSTEYPTHVPTKTSTSATTEKANSTSPTGAKATETHPIAANSASSLKGSYAVVAAFLGAVFYIL